jgi:hypothetical protein
MRHADNRQNVVDRIGRNWGGNYIERWNRRNRWNYRRNYRWDYWWIRLFRVVARQLVTASLHLLAHFR